MKINFFFINYSKSDKKRKDYVMSTMSLQCHNRLYMKNEQNRLKMEQKYLCD